MNDLESKQLQLRTSPLLLLLPPTPPTPNFISLRLQPFNFACLLRTTWNQISWRRLGVRLNFSIHLRIIDIGDSFWFFFCFIYFCFCFVLFLNDWFNWFFIGFHWIASSLIRLHLILVVSLLWKCSEIRSWTWTHAQRRNVSIREWVFKKPPL